MDEAGPPDDDAQKRWTAFGVWLKGRRDDMGLSVREVAEKAGVSLSTWSTLEKGGRVYKGQWQRASSPDRTLLKVIRAVDGDPRQAFELLGRSWSERLATRRPDPVEEDVEAQRLDRIEARLDEVVDKLAHLVERLQQGYAQVERPQRRPIGEPDPRN